MYWLTYSSHTSHHPSQTPCLPWIFYATQKLMIDTCNMLQKQSEAFHTFPNVKHNFMAYRFPKVSDCIFEIHKLWQSGFGRVYSNCCCSCSFEPEIIKIGQLSDKMHSNNIVNFQESTTILNAHTKKNIVIHGQTVSLHQNSSGWLDTLDASSWDRNPSNFVSNHLAISFIYILRYRIPKSSIH